MQKCPPQSGHMDKFLKHHRSATSGQERLPTCNTVEARRIGAIGDPGTRDTLGIAHVLAVVADYEAGAATGLAAEPHPPYHLLRRCGHCPTAVPEAAAPLALPRLSFVRGGRERGIRRAGGKHYAQSKPTNRQTEFGAGH